MSNSKKVVYLLSTVLSTILVFKFFSKSNQTEFEKECIEDIPLEKKEPRYVKKESVFESKLNKRQEDILKLITKRKVVLPSDIYDLHPNVSTRTLRRDMTSLVELNLVKQEGTTRDTRYILKD